MTSRRTVLAQSLVVAGLLTCAPRQALGTAALRVDNITGLHTVAVARIERPTSVLALTRAVRAWPGRIAVGGGRYSMGGQVAVDGGLHIDMRAMNKLVWLRPADRLVRVQAGMRWRDLQDLLDPLGLAVKVMQSYANFTVGGSVSVNAHGRYVARGPVGNTVRAVQLVLADGAVAEVNRRTHPDWFRAVVGGYGAVGIITEVELELGENLRIERVVADVPLVDYVRHFEREVLADPRSVLHNADLMPPHFDAPVCVTWRQTDRPLTDPLRLVPRGQSYAMAQNLLWTLTELPGAKGLRSAVIDPLRHASPVVKWLNHEASLDVAELEPRTRRISTYVLQEFFIPKRHFLGFARGLASTLSAHRVEALNVSIRHSPADTVALLPWAPEEVFSFVLYFKQRTHARALAAVGRWTRELVDLALTHEGRYYLPYQLHATPDQFDRAYPEAAALRELKRELDPRGKWSNALWEKYL